MVEDQGCVACRVSSGPSRVYTALAHAHALRSGPCSARDSVLLKTTYKSPTSVHVFAFSTDDSALFPSIPSSDPAIIRTQVDLQGWSIEALSPTTTHVTLLEQSDPKGWSNKSSIPQIMANSASHPPRSLYSSRANAVCSTQRSPASATSPSARAVLQLSRD